MRPGGKAYKLKLVKWFLLAVVCAIASASPLWADEAADLFAQAAKDSAGGNYKDAAPLFDQVIQNYPTSSNIDEIRIESGVAHLHLNEFDKVVEVLAKETVPPAPAQYRASALYYTGYAQLLKGGKVTDEAGRKTALGQSIESNTKLLDYLKTSTSPDDKPYKELALYNRALAYLYEGDLPHAITDVSTLLSPEFGSSLQKPDYLLLLGNLYARQGAEAMAAKSPDATVQTDSQKAMDAFDQAIADPTARVQGDDAKLAKAEVLYLLASMTPRDPAGYAKALEAFRQVERKADLIPIQQATVDELKKENLTDVQNSGGKKVNAMRNQIIEREEARLDTLNTEPDPILRALIRIAQCYNAMTQGNEARTVLHRLAKADLTADQRQQSDFALIYSYVLGGQSDKADQALTAYLAKHPGDPQAEGISVQIGNELLKRSDAAGALVQAKRSLSDFPKGKYVGEAIELEVEALTALGRNDDAKKVGDDFLRDHPDSPVAVGILLSTAQRQTRLGDLAGAMASYQKVEETASTSELKAAGAAGYIETLESLGRFDDVIAESKKFETTYPDNAALPSILVMRGVAMDNKHDPGAVGVLQDEAKRFPSDAAGSPSPFALFFVVNIYQRANQVPQMVQAADDLKKAFPNQYTYILQAADAVSAVLIKASKFEEAAAQYQSLADAPQPDVAALAEAKIGDVWLAGAKDLQKDSDMPEAQKRMDLAEQSYLSVLKKYPDQLIAVNAAFHGLDQSMVHRRALGLLKQADMEAYLGKVTAGLTSADMLTRIELAKAGLVFIDKHGLEKYPAALTRFKAAIAAAPTLVLTRTESNEYGQLLLAAKDYPTALQVYTALQASNPGDQETQADANYGLGATYLAQGDLSHAKDYFLKMKGMTWSPHILDANYGLALYQETSGQPGDSDAAKQAYAQLMQSPDAAVDLQAKAMLGYGRILVAEGHPVSPAVAGGMESGVHYFQQVDTIYGGAVPELSAEGLYDAGQAYAKAGDKANAQKMYQNIEQNYKDVAPDWAAKATAASAGP